MMQSRTVSCGGEAEAEPADRGGEQHQVDGRVRVEPLHQLAPPRHSHPPVQPHVAHRRQVRGQQVRLDAVEHRRRLRKHESTVRYECRRAAAAARQRGVVRCCGGGLGGGRVGGADAALREQLPQRLEAGGEGVAGETERESVCLLVYPPAQRLQFRGDGEGVEGAAFRRGGRLALRPQRVRLVEQLKSVFN